MVACPTRSGPVLELTLSTTFPFPFPLAPESIAIQPAVLVEVHAQPSTVLTLTDSLPPDASTVSNVRLRSKRHAAAWLSGTRWLDMTIAADLGEGARFAETENPTVPSPCPFVVATLTQLESTETVQVQSRVVLTPMVPLPPLDGKGVEGTFVTVTLHFVPEGALTDVDVLLQAAAIAAHATSAASSCFRVLFRCTTFGLMHAARQAGAVRGRGRAVRVK
jgi:hypothetical protein